MSDNSNSSDLVGGDADIILVLHQSLHLCRALAARAWAHEHVLDQVLYSIVSRMPEPQQREFLASTCAAADDTLSSAQRGPFESETAQADAIAIAGLTHASVGLFLDRLKHRLSPGASSPRGH